MKLGVGIPQSFPNRTIDPEYIRRYLVRAEALGFEGVWTQEQILGRMPTLEPLALMNYAAACTTRLRLGCAVFLTTLRSPVHMAKMLTTLDQLSQGRLDVGVGLGAPRHDAAFGVDSGSRVARFTEGLQVMKALWTAPQVTFAGRFWQLEQAVMEPKPVQQPHPPVWFGASHPDALRRAVRYGDGFIGAGSTSSEQFTDQVKLIHRYLDAAGRDPASYPIGKRVYIGIDANRDRAGTQLAEWFTINYGRSMHEQVAVWGSPDECAERLRKVVASGAEMLVLTALYDEADQLERIAADLAPRLRD
ncbi:MAG TPA: LLM class flavin-dependent oxidoreductase [Chloroflexota bacterium]|nr:LLM class flavin-dependent oxidoreductase [Chloroflexota bacterium]